MYNYLNRIHYIKYAKRYWNFISSLIILFLLLPLLIFIAILIKLTSKGPVFYIQRRIGVDGYPFNMYKFRTMINGSKEEEFITIDNDPRITAIGKILRPLSLDELPQIINILKGDMNFIGPRPISEIEYNSLKNDINVSPELIRDLVPKTKPGILGLAIFYGREKISYKNRARLNKKYEENVSLTFDSYISWKTLLKYWQAYFLFILITIVVLYCIMIFFFNIYS